MIGDVACASRAAGGTSVCPDRESSTRRNPPLRRRRPTRRGERRPLSASLDRPALVAHLHRLDMRPKSRPCPSLRGDVLPARLPPLSYRRGPAIAVRAGPRALGTVLQPAWIRMPTADPACRRTEIRVLVTKRPDQVPRLLVEPAVAAAHFRIVTTSGPWSTRPIRSYRQTRGRARNAASYASHAGCRERDGGDHRGRSARAAHRI